MDSVLVQVIDYSVVDYLVLGKYRVSGIFITFGTDKLRRSEIK